MAAMSQLQQLHRAVASWGVGDEDLVAHAFDSVEQTQLRTGVRPFPAHDHPRAMGVGGQVHAGDQPVQASDTIKTLRQPSARKPTPLLIRDLDVVMVLGPIVTHEQHRLPLHSSQPRNSAEETADDLMDQCSPKPLRGTSSQQWFSLLATSGRTVCRKTSYGVRSGEC